MEKTKLVSICEIRSYLYICGYCTLSEQKFHQLGITAAVDATNIPKTFRAAGVQYLDIFVDDLETTDLKKYFKTVAEFVQKAKNLGKKCLIYCAAGVSRSATLCIATLMIIEGFSLRHSYAHVLLARPIIAPNIGFWRQLIEFEIEKTGVATVYLLKGMRRLIPNVYVYRSSVLKEITETNS